MIKILPSNAPPLETVPSFPSQNVSHLDPDSESYNIGRASCGPTALTHNLYRDYERPHGTRLYYPQQQAQHGWAQWERHHPGLSWEEDARVEHGGRRLYARAQANEQFQRYRERQPKIDTKKRKDQTWPDHIEKAFFYSLFKYPPMGKAQMQHNGTRCGRNMLISDYIQILSGEKRDRKQVSSHIQVLREFFKGDPQILFYMPELEKNRKRAIRNGTSARSSLYRAARRSSSSSRHSVAAPTRPGQALGPTSPFAIDIKALKRSAPMKLLSPMRFHMFMRRGQTDLGDDHEPETLHTYARSSHYPLGNELHVRDWEGLAVDFPLLADMHMHSRQGLDCNVLVANASLAFPHASTTGIELVVEFFCSSACLDTEARIQSQNSFYKNGKYVHVGNSSDWIGLSEGEQQGSFMAHLNFGSRVWAPTLATLGQRLRDAQGSVADVYKAVDAELRGITLVQEIFVSAPSIPTPERVMVIHWSFAAADAHGVASWSRLILPTTTHFNHDPDPAERADSLYDAVASHSSIPKAPLRLHQPTLQSPFEYEGGSSGSALSSATWPTTLSDASHAGLPLSGSAHDDGHFDFGGATSSSSTGPHAAYDSHMAFNGLAFDPAAVANFAADPALHDFAHAWGDPYVAGFDAPHAAIAAAPGDSEAGFDVPPEEGADQHGPGFEYGAGFEYRPSEEQQQQQQQVFGGTRHDSHQEDEALAVLAVASDLARAL